MKYLPLIILACILNWRQRQALFLTLIVGLGLVIPIPKEYGALVWYSLCAAIDVSIMLFALSINARFSLPVALLSCFFVLIHYLGWMFDGYPTDSPYRYFARTIGFTEITVCAVLSNPIVQFIEEKLK